MAECEMSPSDSMPIMRLFLSITGRRREASINDVAIQEAERKFHWPKGPRPEDHPGLTEMDLF